MTKLLGPAKWTYFYLYVILDVFNRYVTGYGCHARKCRLASGSSRTVAPNNASSPVSSPCMPIAAPR